MRSPVYRCILVTPDIARNIGLPQDLCAEVADHEWSRLARVSADFGLRVEVLTPEPLRAAVPRGLREDPGVVVGDWVVLGDGELPPIQRVLPRRHVLVRQAAGRRRRPQALGAHLDTVFVVTSCNRDFNDARLIRYARMIGRSGAEMVIIVNKADLVDDVDAWRERARSVVEEFGRSVEELPEHERSTFAPIRSGFDGDGARADGTMASDELPPLAEVIVLSAHAQDVRSSLARWNQPGRTLAFVGSSGTGKSTLINALAGDERMRTSDIRARDDEGRHTTTHRQLVQLVGGAMLLDTPGIREVEAWETPEEAGRGRQPPRSRRRRRGKSHFRPE